jgi:hypothetical protein
VTHRRANTRGTYAWQLYNRDEKNENLAEAHIDFTYNRSIPFQHKIQHGDATGPKIKVLMISASKGEGSTLEDRMYSTMSKMYYARRHGYGFTHLLSEQYADYFADDLYTVRVCCSLIDRSHTLSYSVCIYKYGTTMGF